MTSSLAALLNRMLAPTRNRFAKILMPMEISIVFSATEMEMCIICATMDRLKHFRGHM
jgi:hypothetical protein